MAGIREQVGEFEEGHLGKKTPVGPWRLSSNMFYYFRKNILVIVYRVIWEEGVRGQHWRPQVQTSQTENEKRTN